MDKDKSDRTDESLPLPPGGVLSTGTQCLGVKPDGSACKRQALPGSEFCFFHDPKRRSEVVEAGRRGGSRKAVELPEGDLLTPEKARRILSGVISGTLSGEVPESVARTVGYLLQIEARVREGHDLEKRIEVLEAIRKMQEKAQEQAKERKAG